MKAFFGYRLLLLTIFVILPVRLVAQTTSERVTSIIQSVKREQQTLLCAKALNPEVAGLDSSYELLNWDLPHEQPAGAFQIRKGINEMDEQLWERTLELGGKECGVLEYFDNQGNLLYRSDIIDGSYGEITEDKWQPIWTQEILPVVATFQKSGVLRFSHTHPETGLIMRGGKVGIVIPQFLSPNDLKVVVDLRRELNKTLESLGPTLKINLEMVSFTVKKIALGDIFEMPSGLPKFAAFLGFGNAFPVKSAVVLP